jgi:hypothetical protein
MYCYISMPRAACSFTGHNTANRSPMAGAIQTMHRTSYVLTGPCSRVKEGLRAQGSLHPPLATIPPTAAPWWHIQAMHRTLCLTRSLWQV